MDFDVVIVGGGLAGLSLAVALKRSRLSIGLVEARAPVQPEGWDARIYAVSPANARFLDEIGAWGHLDAARMSPVHTMEVYGDAGGRLDFSAYDAGVGELAWIVESSLMQRELWETAKRQGNVTLLCPGVPRRLTFAEDAATLTLADGRELTSRLIVAADGADSWTREAAGIEVTFKPYEQHGVVANFATARPHREVACQWFRHDGVLAYLPLPGNLISIVWSTPADHAAELLALSPEAFCDRVADAGGRRLGALSPVTPPAGFPLRLMRAPCAVAPRLALIGDAAHAIHPLSGHGINLGFQDARALAEVLLERPDHVDCGDVAWLRRYERARREEVVALQSVTDGLQRLFALPGQPFSSLRNLGLNFTHRLPVVKDLLVRYAMG
ncbi:MAG: UbiH/UbiF family hydroxylase [Gammaproteobacteria bacterium]|nr:UbiH/UbiF family hydroxylase [Gammaproteobacteria bacterium]MBU1414479.1 UbiH/UbiF family hydroxylase [Gammaproteobacteria bacterium]